MQKCKNYLKETFLQTRIYQLATHSFGKSLLRFEALSAHNLQNINPICICFSTTKCPMV